MTNREGNIRNSFHSFVLIFQRLLKRRHQGHASGFSLVEVLVDLAIISIVAMAVASAYFAAFKSIDLAKAKIASVALANEKMEQIRNMPYDKLATEHGAIYPAGTILDDEEIVRKGIRFNVHTVLSYVDDPFDGNAEGTVAGKPQDLYPYDYKKVEVTVSKIGRNGYLSRLSSNIAAKAAETESNTGIIKLCVIDSTGQAVPGSTIKIQNLYLTPAVDIEATTASNGCIMVPALPEDERNQYHLEAAKTGYSTDMTYERTEQNPNATQPNVDVLTQQITSQTFIIDRLSRMDVTLSDTNDTPVANTNVHIWGSKTKWFNPDTYKYDQNLITNTSGQITLNDMEFDDYNFTVDGWNIVATSPYQPVNLKANTTLAVNITVSQSVTYPTIFNVLPLSSPRGSLASISLDGKYISGPPTVKLINGLGEEINAQNITYNQHGQDEWLDMDLDLTSAAVGLWDIVLTNPNGDSVRQKNGFEVSE